MLVNTAAGRPISASLAEVLSQDLEERVITEARSKSGWVSFPDEGMRQLMVGTLRVPDQLAPAPPCCLDCLVWLQKELLAVLDDVLQQGPASPGHQQPAQQ
jgi:hypothetical protein